MASRGRTPSPGSPGSSPAQLRPVGRGRGHLGHEDPEIALEGDQEDVEFPTGGLGPGQPDGRPGPRRPTPLASITAAFLRHPGTPVEQARGAVVAFSRVDLDHRAACYRPSAGPPTPADRVRRSPAAFLPCLPCAAWTSTNADRPTWRPPPAGSWSSTAPWARPCSWPGLSADDFGGPDLEGCNEPLVVTRPDAVAAVHRAFLDVGCDVVETDAFGAFAWVLAEYGHPDRVPELAAAVGPPGARRGRRRRAAPAGWSAPGTGHQAPDPGPHHLRRAARRLPGPGDRAARRRRRPPDHRDRARPAPGQGGHDRRKAGHGGGRAPGVPLIVQVTIETTGRCCSGTEIGAALDRPGAAAARPDRAELRHRPGRDERAPALPGRHARPALLLPNAGLPSLRRRLHYPLTPAQLAEPTPASRASSAVAGRRLLRHHPRAPRRRGRPPAGGLTARARRPAEPAAASLYSHVPFRQDTSFLAIGERTNANGSKAFRDAMLEGSWDDCVPIARAQTRDGAHLLDLCVDYVGRDGVADMPRWPAGWPPRPRCRW